MFDVYGIRSWQAKELEKTAATKGVEIILPTDVIVADAFSADANTQVREARRAGTPYFLLKSIKGKSAVVWK